MTEYTDIGWQQAEKIVTEAKENDFAIRLDRIGATPWLAYTPYTNNEGVTINLWSLISYQFQAQPERTLLSLPTIVKPWEHEDWEINQIHTPWVVSQVAKSRIVKTKPIDESPFSGGIVGGWCD